LRFANVQTADDRDFIHCLFKRDESCEGMLTGIALCKLKVCRDFVFHAEKMTAFTNEN